MSTSTCCPSLCHKRCISAAVCATSRSPRMSTAGVEGIYRLACRLFLRQHRAQREGECLLLGKTLCEQDLVFANTDGAPMDPGTLTHNFTKIARRAGLPGVRFHDLRHTFASLTLLGDIHPKMVSEALGYSSVAFTLDVYSHLVPGLQRAAMRRPDEILVTCVREDENVGKGWRFRYSQRSDSNRRPAVYKSVCQCTT